MWDWAKEISLQALHKLRMSRTELCWCNVAIENPMVRNHTDGCTTARQAYERLTSEKEKFKSGGDKNT